MYGRILLCLALAGCCEEYTGQTHECSCLYEGKTVHARSYCVRVGPTETANALARDCTPDSAEVNPCDSCSCGPALGACSDESCPRKSLTETDDAIATLEARSRLVCTETTPSR